ncbi:MAG TPA: NfeD family protein [Desulfobulbus sp.]|nr:NfeD family protein [Desulfobulbus sp.]
MPITTATPDCSACRHAPGSRGLPCTFHGLSVMVISPILAWFLAGILFFVTELALPGFIVFFFGIGAWCVALVLWFVDCSLSAQLGLFIVSSLVFLLLLRSWLRTIFSGRSLQEDDSATVQPASVSGIVTRDIVPPAEGQVKYGGSFWRAAAEEKIVSGTVVRIVEQKGLLVRVVPLESNREEN